MPQYPRAWPRAARQTVRVQILSEPRGGRSASNLVRPGPGPVSHSQVGIATPTTCGPSVGHTGIMSPAVCWGHRGQQDSPQPKLSTAHTSQRLALSFTGPSSASLLGSERSCCRPSGTVRSPSRCGHSTAALNHRSCLQQTGASRRCPPSLSGQEREQRRNSEILAQNPG